MDLNRPRSRRRVLRHLAGAALALPCLAGAGKTATLESFELPDQFGKNHRIEFPRNRPLLLLVGDRRGSEEVDAWIGPLKEHWGKVADIAGIADVHGIPSLFRERARAAIRERRPREVMLDFEGRITAALGCADRTANVFLVDPSGRVVARVEGKPSDAKLAVFREVFDRWSRT